MKMYANRFYLVIAILIPLSCFGEDWTEFRGPTGQGLSNAKNVPTRWSQTENILWKTEIPGSGWSSPVFQDGRIWLTSALDHGQSLHVYCVDLKSGKPLMDIPVFENNSPKKIHNKNSHASPTALINGDRIYVHFGTYGTACLTTKGDVIWRRQLKYEPLHGPGGSPALHQDRLLINCDGTDLQYVVALDKDTGKTIWETKRAHASDERRNGEKMSPIAFSTPLVVQQNGITQVVSAGADHVAGYDVTTGKELWWSEYDGYSVVPRPVFAKGVLFVSSCYDGPEFYAIKLGGTGNVTESHVLWSIKRGAPHNPSPIVVGDEVYVVNDAGIATCLDIVSGEKHWQKRLGGKYSASPIFANGRLYFTNEDGNTSVLRPGKQFDLVGINEMNERTLASLAPMDGGLILRTESVMYRIGK